MAARGIYLKGGWKLVLGKEGRVGLAELLAVVLVVIEGLMEVEVMHARVDYTTSDVGAVVADTFHASK